jgi:hypothetical protein
MRKWTSGGVILVLLLVAMAAILLGPGIHRFVRERTQKVLQTHFASIVEFSDCDVTLFPRLQVTIAGLVLRHNGRSDIPPLIQIRTVIGPRPPQPRTASFKSLYRKRAGPACP